jgi:hypothetical protein
MKLWSSGINSVFHGLADGMGGRIYIFTGRPAIGWGPAVLTRQCSRIKIVPVNALLYHSIRVYALSSQHIV